MKNYIRKLIREVLDDKFGGCDYFLDRTNLPDYDDVLFDVVPRIFSNSYGGIEWMSADEYYRRSSEIQGGELRLQTKYIRDDNKDKIKSRMENGVKYNLPYLDYSENRGQEGRHRVMAAFELGCKKIPVMVVYPKQEERNGESIINMIGTWSDLKKNGRGNLVIIYDLSGKSFKEDDMFLKLYSKNYDSYFLDDILGTIQYSNKSIELVLLKNSHIKDIGKYEVDVMPHNLISIIKNRIEKLNKAQYEDFYDGDVKNIDDDFLLSFVDGVKELFPNLYNYLCRLIASIRRYMILNRNKYLFDGFEFEGGRIDIENKIGLLEIVDEDLFGFMDLNKYSSARGLMKDYSPIVDNLSKYGFLSEDDHFKLSGKIAKMFVDRFPFA